MKNTGGCLHGGWSSRLLSQGPNQKNRRTYLDLQSQPLRLASSPRDLLFPLLCHRRHSSCLFPAAGRLFLGWRCSPLPLDLSQVREQFSPLDLFIVFVFFSSKNSTWSECENESFNKKKTKTKQTNKKKAQMKQAFLRFLFNDRILV